MWMMVMVEDDDDERLKIGYFHKPKSRKLENRNPRLGGGEEGFKYFSETWEC